MRQTAFPTRTATNRSAERPHRSARTAAQALRRLAALALLFSLLAAFVPRAHAQTALRSRNDLHPAAFQVRRQLRLRLLLSARSHGRLCRTAPFHGFGPVVSLNGLAVTNLRPQIDIHQASFLGGGRYTYSLGHITPTIWNRRGSIFAEGLVGDSPLPPPATIPSGNKLVSNASGFTYALGGGINYNLYHRFELRLMSHYFITDLPNGGTNQQKNIQVSAGVNWHFGN